MLLGAIHYKCTWRDNTQDENAETEETIHQIQLFFTPANNFCKPVQLRVCKSNYINTLNRWYIDQAG